MHATYEFLVLIALTLVILLATCSAGVELLEVHGPDGQTYYVNPAEISSLRAPTNTELQRYFSPGTHCIISTTNRRFIAAREMCSDIRDRLKHSQP